jgi:rhodanese-related sulfurtransferase
VKTARHILTLLAIASALGAGANALSPRGLSWSRPLGRGIGPQVADAGLVPIDLKTMRGILGDRSYRLIDVRSREDFAIGRLPGAVNIPWNPDAQTPSVLVAPDKWVVVYCSNEFCEQALQSATQLKRVGYRDVAVFVDGYEAWWNAGGPVDQD